MKSIALSKSGIAKTPNCEISQGVSKAILKFPHKAVIRMRKYGSSFINLPFPRNARLESPIDLASRRESRQSCSINSFPASQVETVEVETFLLSSQGSRIVSMEKSSIVHSFLVRALNLQILKNQTRKYAQDRSKL
jgi:hypothetical protein